MGVKSLSNQEVVWLTDMLGEAIPTKRFYWVLPAGIRKRATAIGQCKTAKCG